MGRRHERSWQLSYSLSEMARRSFAWTVSFGSALAASVLVTSISACTADDRIGPGDCDGSSCEGPTRESSTDGSGPGTDAAVADASVLDGSSADASRALDDLEALYAIDCTSCGYSWYSLAGADVGRFVKNTNIEMAVASFALDRYFPDATRTRRSAPSEDHHCRWRARPGNRT